MMTAEEARVDLRGVLDGCSESEVKAVRDALVAGEIDGSVYGSSWNPLRVCGWREMLRLNIPGATIDPDDTLERIAAVMHGHPDVASVEVDYGLSTLVATHSPFGKHPGAYGFAIALQPRRQPARTSRR